MVVRVIAGVGEGVVDAQFQASHLAVVAAGQDGIGAPAVDRRPHRGGEARAAVESCSSWTEVLDRVGEPSRWQDGFDNVDRFDDTTRDTASLLATTRGLVSEGVSAYCLTGGYHLPLVTLTGDVRGDIVHIDRIIGVGEVAISEELAEDASPKFASAERRSVDLRRQ